MARHLRKMRLRPRYIGVTHGWVIHDVLRHVRSILVIPYYMPYDDIIIAQVFGMVTSERFMPSYQGSSAKSGSQHGQEYDQRIMIKIGNNLFNQDNVTMASNCKIVQQAKMYAHY
jgi:hypothetical protein